MITRELSTMLVMLVDEVEPRETCMSRKAAPKEQTAAVSHCWMGRWPAGLARSRALRDSSVDNGQKVALLPYEFPRGSCPPRLSFWGAHILSWPYAGSLM